MAVTIQMKRGVFANIPALQDGEFFLATDSGQLYVGLNGLLMKVGTSVMSAVSLSDNTGKTNILKTAVLVTTATTANQAILSYTVTNGKTLFLQLATLIAGLTAASATGSLLGTVQITIGGTVVYTTDFRNPTISMTEREQLVFAEPIPIAAAVPIVVQVTPSAVTSMRWVANLSGYEK